jgi:hypothetical protein
MRAFAWVLVLAGLLDGCTTNTPQQDYIYDMARPCEGKGIRLDYVSPDGQQWRGLVVHPSSSMPEFAQCLRENATRTPFEKWRRDNNIN